MPPAILSYSLKQLHQCVLDLFQFVYLYVPECFQEQNLVKNISLLFYYIIFFLTSGTVLWNTSTEIRKHVWETV